MEGKSSFLLYCDLMPMVSKMPDEEAGKLFKLIFEYTNDLNPDESKYGILVEVAFAQVKNILKKDLEKWKGTVQKNTENGKKSAEARKKNKLKESNDGERPLTTVTQPSTNSTDKDKDKEDTAYQTEIPQDDHLYKPTEKEVVDFFHSKGYSEKQAKKFFNHYNVRDWNNQNGVPVEYWKVTAHDWFDDKHKNPVLTTAARVTEIMNLPKLSESEWNELNRIQQIGWQATHGGSGYSLKER